MKFILISSIVIRIIIWGVLGVSILTFRCFFLLSKYSVLPLNATRFENNSNRILVQAHFRDFSRLPDIYVFHTRDLCFGYVT